MTGPQPLDDKRVALVNEHLRLENAYDFPGCVGVFSLGTWTFPRKRLVKSCTRRLRGNVTNVAAGAIAIQARMPCPRHERCASKRSAVSPVHV
jgi:hypothetical protein